MHAAAPPCTLSAAGFATLATTLREISGLSIGPDKLYLLAMRLAGLLREEGLCDLDALAARLRQPGERPLGRRVAEAMTTNESLFFRDRTPFEHVRDHALPALLAARPAGRRLRLWSAGAATGQEAFSLAMILAETLPAGRSAEILATDIARQPLDRARTGRFSQFEIQRGLPIQSLARHFIQEASAWRIKSDIRALVAFRDHNLLDDMTALGRFDLVFCRNVLLYFDPPTRARVLAGIARQMPPDGLIYLGGAETMLGICDRFLPVAGQRGVYRLG